MASRTQSALHAAEGSSAAVLDQLGTILYAGAGTIFIVVIGLVVFAVLSRAREVRAERWVIGGGLVFPAVVLSVLLVYSLTTTKSVLAIGARGEDADEPIRVHVIGKQWWWDVRYEVPGAQETVVLANELHVPVGRAVEILLHSTDVIHSFWAPSLAGKVDMIPGRTTRVVIRTDEEGVFRGQCAEYCGGQHALMAFYVIAEPEDRFQEWLGLQARPATAPTDPFLREGYDAFFRGDCQECHAVRGTEATGESGPDLTHVGGRRSLAAGVLDNHIGTMAGWIAGSQEAKPGNLMPSMNVYTGRELRALSAWLGSLE
jgi:cytochrome c oxidase subunit 2